MITLSYRQPMPTLIALGLKPIENRTWRLPEKYKGQRVLIHASGRAMTWQHTLAYIRALEHGEEILEIFEKNNFDGEWLRNLPTSAIIGSVIFTDCAINHPSMWAEKTDVPSFGDVLDDLKFLGRTIPPDPINYNWILSEPVLFDHPILDVKGKLNFWEYNGIECQDIICPKCGSIEHAIVDLRTWPWNTYIHDCRKCGHTIMESEWEKVKNNE